MSSEGGGMVLTPCTLPLDLPLIANQQTFLQHKKHPLKPYLLNIQHFFLLLTFRTGAFSSAMRISWILSTKWNQGSIGCYCTSRNKRYSLESDDAYESFPLQSLSHNLNRVSKVVVTRTGHLKEWSQGGRQLCY